MFLLRTLNSIMNEIYERVKENKPFDKNLKPYSINKIQGSLDYFESREEFEKCQILTDYLSKLKHGKDF